MELPEEITVASAAALKTAPSSPPAETPVQNTIEAPQVVKPTRSVRRPEDYASPTGKHEELKDDLSDFGFGTAQVKGLMGKREFYVDSTVQRPQYQTREEREAERSGLDIVPARPKRRMATAAKSTELERAVKRIKVRGEKAEGLVITGGGNWVLFDPEVHEFSPHPNGAAPAIFQKYMHFQPGNARILEYNFKSASVRLKTTPLVLAGKIVDYTKAGPKLVDPKIEPSPPPPPPPPPPSPKRKRGRPKGKGGRGESAVVSQKDEIASPAQTRTSGRLKIAPKPMVKEEPMGDNDTGSESSLSEPPGAEIEIGDSQEVDMSLS